MKVAELLRDPVGMRLVRRHAQRAPHIALAAMLLAGASAPADAAFDFVSHNGFAACYTTSKDAAGLSALILDYVEGAPACIPAQTQGTITYCYDTVCADQQPGCPTVLHGSTSAYVQGASRFDTQGGLDPVAGSITLPFVGECHFAIDTANVVLSYSISYSALPEYGLVPDGNNGFYQTAATVGTIAANGLKSTDYSLSGSNFACTAAGTSSSIFAGILTQVEGSIQAAVQPTLDYAWCPWPF